MRCTGWLGSTGAPAREPTAYDVSATTATPATAPAASHDRRGATRTGGSSRGMSTGGSPTAAGPGTTSNDSRRDRPSRPRVQLLGSGVGLVGGLSWFAGGGPPTLTSSSRPDANAAAVGTP